MPRVPVYGPRRVGPMALPGARLTAATTAEALGAGVEEARAGLGRVQAGVFGDVAERGARIFGRMEAEKRRDEEEEAEKEKRRAQAIQELEFRNQYSAWEQSYLYEGDQAALNRRGKNALGLVSESRAEFEKRMSAIGASITDPDVRIRFEEFKSDRAIALGLTMNRHVAGEIREFEAGELEALKDNAHTTIVQNYRDLKRVEVEMTSVVNAIRRHGANIGLGPEKIDADIRAFQSQNHIGVIERMLENDETRAAQVYFDEAKEQISAQGVIRVEKALAEGVTRKKAQTEADRILAEGGTLTEQREKARQIEDPQLRDAVTSRLEHEANVRDREEREQDETRMTAAVNLVEKAKDIRAIPPAQWAALSLPQRSQLRNYAEQLVRGVPVQTDYRRYYALIQQAGTDPEKFAEVNLLNYKGSLDEGDFKMLANAQLQIRNGNRKAAADLLDTPMTVHQTVDNTLRRYGVDPNDKDKQQGIALLRSELERQLGRMQGAAGAKVQNKDVEAALQDLLEVQFTRKATWMGFLDADPFWKDTTKRIHELEVGDIPAADLSQIKAELKRRGRAETPEAIVQIYVQGELMKRRGGR